MGSLRPAIDEREHAWLNTRRWHLRLQQRADLQPNPPNRSTFEHDHYSPEFAVHPWYPPQLVRYEAISPKKVETFQGASRSSRCRFLCLGRTKPSEISRVQRAAGGG